MDQADLVDYLIEAQWKHIHISKLNIMDSDNGLLPGQRQAII